MNTYHVIDKDSWPRRELFDFYQKFVNPNFNVSVSIDAKRLYEYAKDRDESFFLLTLYSVLRAANMVPQLRQRVVDGRIVEFERIGTLTPVMTPDELFRQVWCEYRPTVGEFIDDAAPRIEAAKAAAPGPEKDHGEDYICASCVPWLHFSSITQADLVFGQAVPILAWGKMKDGQMPFSCKFCHSFVDGLHVSRFFGVIEECLAEPEVLGKAVEVPGR